MEQFITMAADKLGVDQGVVRTAINVVLNLIKEHAAGSDFQTLVAKLPGAGTILREAESGDDAGGGGLLGQAAGALGGMLGGGSTLGALAKLQGTGLDTGQHRSHAVRQRRDALHHPVARGQAAGPEQCRGGVDPGDQFLPGDHATAVEDRRLAGLGGGGASQPFQEFDGHRCSPVCSSHPRPGRQCVPMVRRRHRS